MRLVDFAEPVIELGRGLVRTFASMFEKPVTIQYPEQKRPVRPRFRGRHVLKRYENGLEKCIGCSLCAAACPADAIFVEAAENTDEKRFSPGERYASTYEINMLRCIYCGYCEDACPTEAIVLGDNYELSFTDRRQAIYPKEMLLEPVPDTAMLTPQKTEPGKYTRSVPEMKDAEDRSMSLDMILFLILAAVSVATGLGMLFSRSAIYSALFLVLNFVTVAIFYLLLGAPFIAISQITVYAGAIMVLFLFVIMLLGTERLNPSRVLPWQRWLAILLAFVLTVEGVYLLVWRVPASAGILSPGDETNAVQAIRELGSALFNSYLLPFEVTSILLLVAMVGAIVLSKPDKGG